jgi:ribonuclease P protein component
MNHRDIETVMRVGTRVFGKHVTYYLMPHHVVDIAAIAPKKHFPQAVSRVRVRRRLRAVLRVFTTQGVIQSMMCIAVAKKSALVAPYSELVSDISLLEKFLNTN